MRLLRGGPRQAGHTQGTWDWQPGCTGVAVCDHNELSVYSCPCDTQEVSDMQQVHGRVPTTPTAYSYSYSYSKWSGLTSLTPLWEPNEAHGAELTS